MPFTLRFSDVSNTQTVTVPDMPPGINTVDTSLSLVGKNYPNYGEKIAENFLHLLENFASPIPPDNPIEGQLWYDTSNPTQKVLRIMDGTTTNTRWPSATGIYQQENDPKNVPNAGLKTGDIWVDTANNQLKIYKNNSWILVGPSAQGEETGSFPEELTDTTNVKHWVVRVKVEGDTVAIFYNGPDAFTPNPVIPGFTGPIRPGVTISSQYSSRLNSTALAALNLEINSVRYSADKFLRKNDTTGVGQIIEGKVSYITPSNQTGSQGRDGLIINVNGAQSSEYLQIYKLDKDGIFLNNKSGGKLIFKTNPVSGVGLIDTLTIENRSVAINTSTNASSPTLNVYGTAQVLSTLTVISTASTSVVLNGGIVVGKGIKVNETLQVTGVSTFSNTLVTGNVRPLSLSNSLGTANTPYQNVYAVNVYAQNYLQQPGTQTLWGVFPEDFGAIGNGVANDYSALQAAIDTGRPVFLSKGKTYYYTTGLSITSSFQRFGGPGVLKPHGNINAITVTGAAEGVELDLTFNAPTLAGCAVRIDNANRTTIKKLHGLDIGSANSTSSVLYIQKANVCVVEWLWAITGGKGITWYGSDSLRSDILQINFAVIDCNDNQYGLDWDGNCHSLEIDYLGLVGTRGIIIRNTSGGSTFPAIGKFNHIEIDYPTDHGIQITAGLDYDFNIPYVLGAGSTVPGSTKHGMKISSNINDYQVRISGGKFIGNTGYGIENLGGILYFDGTTDLSNNTLGRSYGLVWTTLDKLTLNDDQFYLEKIGENPTIAFSSSSTLAFDRSTDQYNFVTANTGILALNKNYVQTLKPVIMPTYTVATLPSTGLVAGMRAFISDCTTSTFNTNVTGLGGGSFYVPVFCNNSGQWRIG